MDGPLPSRESGRTVDTGDLDHKLLVLGKPKNVCMPSPSSDGRSGSTTLYTYPYVFLSTRAALFSMDASLISAARTLNRTPLQAIREVTVPQITPTVGAGSLLVALYAISDFGTPAFMGVEVFTSAIYWEYGAFDVEYAALLSLQLLAVTAVVLLIEARIGQDDGGPGGAGGEIVRLGRWRWPAAASMALVAVVTLAVLTQEDTYDS